jgi:hypothetical protein
MDVDRVIVVKARDDIEINNDLVDVDNNLHNLIEIDNDPMEVD